MFTGFSNRRDLRETRYQTQGAPEKSSSAPAAQENRLAPEAIEERESLGGKLTVCGRFSEREVIKRIARPTVEDLHHPRKGHFQLLRGLESLQFAIYRWVELWGESLVGAKVLAYLPVVRPDGSVRNWLSYRTAMIWVTGRSLSEGRSQSLVVAVRMALRARARRSAT
jgi:hypothetical protein